MNSMPAVTSVQTACRAAELLTRNRISSTAETASWHKREWLLVASLLVAGLVQ